MSESEVARLRAHIECECEALSLLVQGFAVVARHETIANRYQRLGAYQVQLERLVGSEEAIRVLSEAYNASMQ